MTRRAVLSVLIVLVVACSFVALRWACDADSRDVPGGVGAASALEPADGHDATRADRVPRNRPGGADPSDDAVSDTDALADVVAARDGPGDGAAPRITGTVLDGSADEHLPLAGARVSLWRGVPRAAEVPRGAFAFPAATCDAETTTDAAGRFALDAPAEAAWHIVVEAPEHERRTAGGEGAADLGSIVLGVADPPVRIRVVDDEMRPLADAEAWLLAGSFDASVAGRATADAHGVIVLAGVSGPVVVTAPGCEAEWMHQVRDGEEVRLGPGVPTSGRVVDARGAAVAGALVVVQECTENWICVTDADGRFAFEHLEPTTGDDGAIVYVTTRGGERFDARVRPGDDDARIVVPELVEVRGVAVLEDGRPAAGAVVDGVHVGDDGSFTLRMAAGDRCVVVATLFGTFDGLDRPTVTHQGEGVVDLRAGAPAAQVRVVLRTGGVSFVRYSVVDPDGNGVAGAILGSRYGYRGPTSRADVQQFRAPPGTEVLVAGFPADAKTWSPGEWMPVRTSARADGDPVVLRLRPLVRSSLRVVRADESVVPAAEIRWISVRAGSARVEGGTVVAQAGAACQFEVVTRSGATASWFLELPSRDGDVVVLRLPATITVRGRFVRAGGAPVSGVYPSVAPRGRSDGRVPAGGAPSGDDGRFVVENAAAGAADFVGWREPYIVVASRELELLPAAALDLGDVIVWDDVRLEGRVVFPDGRPAVGADVQFLAPRAASGRRVWEDRTATRADGRFGRAVPAMPRIVVAVRVPGRGAAVLDVDPSAARPLDVRLRPVGTVAVTVGPEIGASPWDVHLESPSGAVAWAPSTDSEDGTTRLLDVPEGRWVVVVTTPSGELRRTADVAGAVETAATFGR